MMSIMDDTKKKMTAALDFFSKEISSLRTNRAHTAMVEDIFVPAYNSRMRLRDVATITIPESRQLLITPYDASLLGIIGKAIEKENLNLQINQHGNAIRILFPPLSEEARKLLVKQVKKKGEDAKITIRNIRQESNKEIKKQKVDGIIAEDEHKRLEKHVQEQTDLFCKHIDELTESKGKEILEV